MMGGNGSLRVAAGIQPDNTVHKFALEEDLCQEIWFDIWCSTTLNEKCPDEKELPWLDNTYTMFQKLRIAAGREAKKQDFHVVIMKSFSWFIWAVLHIRQATFTCLLRRKLLCSALISSLVPSSLTNTEGWIWRMVGKRSLLTSSLVDSDQSINMNKKITPLLQFVRRFC